MTLVRQLHRCEFMEQASEAREPKDSLLARTRTHTVGQERPFRECA